MSVPPPVSIELPPPMLMVLVLVPGAAPAALAPANRLTLSAPAPALIWHEMTKAYEHGARTFWVVNVGDLARLDETVTEVTPAVLADRGLVRRGDAPVKVLGGGELARALTVTASKFSGSAKAKIEKAGGKALTISD